VSVAIRVDASTAIGWGHAMRCLALAQALAERPTFVMSAPPPAFVARAEPDADVVAGDDVAQVLAIGADWVVVDGYHLGSDYQRALQEGGARVLVVDDHAHLDRYHADVLLNQNLGAPDYRERAPGARLLIGPRYALLRREFRDVPARDTPDVARRVLATLGGSDPDGVTAQVVRALARVDRPLEVQVIAGAGNPHLTELERAAAACPHPVDLVVDARDMPRRMAWAELAVTAAGSTSWELARVGTPQIAIVLADNQRPIARGLADAGLAVSLGWHADVTDERIADAVAALVADAGRRDELSRRGRELVDGRGALRVLAAMGAA
jgi:UDP-2,4-diacetamido-2,4,6-trideoxy-beta-L-altropyranose hydrolase